MWQNAEFQAREEAVAGQSEVSLIRHDPQPRDAARGGGTDHLELELHLSGGGAVRDLAVTSSGHQGFSEIFLTAPNLNGIEIAHPLQVVYQGLDPEHPDAQFGRQWMFSPPPMVLPFHASDGWYGVALAAPQGLNMFSGWSYRPSATDRLRYTGGGAASADTAANGGTAATTAAGAAGTGPATPGPADGGEATDHASASSIPSSFTLEIHYDGYFAGTGHVASVFLLTQPRETAREVILWYAELLREKGWAPRPEREPAGWWREPLLCPWGEQVNQGGAKGPSGYGSVEINMYETQANQERFNRLLEERGVPVGVVSMSDKWQLHRERMVPDTFKYPDLRGFVDGQHAAGRHVIAWYGTWRVDDPPADWCLRTQKGERLSVDPESEGFASQLAAGIRELISPDGYDVDGFFVDFTSEVPVRENLQKAGGKWGFELLHHYLKIIHDSAKAVKPDAMIMTHCPHPLFTDVTDVLRLNDWAFRRPDVVEQARYRHGIASAVSDWLINTDNWFMYDISEWRRYLRVQPELGIPASWYAVGVRGDGTHRYEAFTEDDYREWARIWTEYRRSAGLDVVE